jgi:hypothetical protein
MPRDSLVSRLWPGKGPLSPGISVGRRRHHSTVRAACYRAGRGHYQHALALSEELGMRPLQAHCHHGLGTLYRQIGRDALARTALSTAIELYRAMDMTFWLPAAEAALAPVA